MTQPNPDGSPLWIGLSIAELQNLIRYSAAELRRVYELRAQLAQERFRYYPAVEAEIKFWERCHDNHFAWLRNKMRIDETPGARQAC